MRILFAVSNNDNGKNDIVDVILDEYQRVYKKIISPYEKDIPSLR